MIFLIQAFLAQTDATICFRYTTGQALIKTLDSLWAQQGATVEAVLTVESKKEESEVSLALKKYDGKVAVKVINIENLTGLGVVEIVLLNSNGVLFARLRDGARLAGVDCVQQWTSGGNDFVAFRTLTQYGTTSLRVSQRSPRVSEVLDGGDLIDEFRRAALSFDMEGKVIRREMVQKAAHGLKESGLGFDSCLTLLLLQSLGEVRKAALISQIQEVSEQTTADFMGFNAHQWEANDLQVVLDVFSLISSASQQIRHDQKAAIVSGLQEELSRVIGVYLQAHGCQSVAFREVSRNAAQRAFLLPSVQQALEQQCQNE